MQHGQTSIIDGVKIPVRPALIADRSTLRNYADPLRHLLTGLADEPCQAVIICPPDADAEKVLCPSIELIRHPILRIPLFRSQNRKILFDKLEKFKPTVLHCLSGSKARLTTRIAGQLDIPYVFTFNAIAGSFFRRRVSVSHCASLIASSEVISDYLAKVYPRLSGRIEQINIGVFVDDTCACFSETSRVASMVTTKALDRLSDFEPLLNAIRHLAIDGYEFFYAIIGSGPAERQIHELIKGLGLSQVVTIIPAIDPIRTVFAGADIFIQPQASTEFDSRVLEAMSVGMAVATARGGIDDVLIEDKTAVFFDPDDELRIYSALQKLLDKHDFARELALAGQIHLKKHHSVSRMVDALVQTYRNAQQWYKSQSSNEAEK
jgi:glycosyltransferase involved in cell wall biosynthesis